MISSAACLSPLMSAYLLADRGYDVWLANCRGNMYSRRHRRLEPNFSFEDSVEYWNFSFHQLGVYDLPTMIDYILAVNTAYPTIHYIGHGQGTTAFFVMASKRPQYNHKIQLMQAFAPIAYLEGAGNYLISMGRMLDNLNVTLFHYPQHRSNDHLFRNFRTFCLKLLSSSSWVIYHSQQISCRTCVV